MSDQQTFAVARIMKHRQSATTGQIEYYVRWKDENNESEMTPDTDTWEPTSSFVDGEKSSAIQGMIRQLDYDFVIKKHIDKIILTHVI